MGIKPPRQGNSQMPKSPKACRALDPIKPPISRDPSFCYSPIGNLVLKGETFTIGIFYSIIITKTMPSRENVHNLCKPGFPPFPIEFTACHKIRDIFLSEQIYSCCKVGTPSL
jgi:hypothetical protein